jgi:NAD(P)-dependent dehydrogenase (short-subunit alcohol dehydrogenase family)
MSALVEAERLSTSNLFDIGGRNALITGGTSGIGFMIAKGLIANGIRQLFITGIEPNAIVDQKVAELHLFAKESGRNPQIFG